MKTDTKDTNIADLEFLQSQLRKIERQQKKLNTCQVDMAEMQGRILQIGKPSYKNDKAVEELARLKQRLELCSNEATELENEAPALLHELYDGISPVSDRAAMLLRPLVERRISTITAAMMPFCSTQTSALNAAQSTDAYREANRAVSRVAQTPPVGPELVRHARVLVSIFEEAAKKDGDLLQFLAPGPLGNEVTITAPAAGA